MTTVAYELDRVRSAIDGVTKKCRAITISGVRPRMIDVALLEPVTAALEKRIRSAISRELGAEAFANYVVVVLGQEARSA